MSIIKSFAFALISLSAAQVFAGPVNINTADAMTLQQELKGVGPVVANRIVEFRSSNGEFASIDQLAQVKGVGEKTLAKNADFILLK